MAEVIELGPHTNMTTEECLKYCARHADEYENVIILAKGTDGTLHMHAANIDNAEAVLVLLHAIDSARGK